MAPPQFESWLEYHLRSRSQEHLSRKFFHMISGTIVGFLFVSMFSRIDAIFWMGMTTLFLISFDLLRLKVPAVNGFIIRSFGRLMRKEEAGGPSAQLFYLLGLCWAIFFLPRPVAVHAIFTLAWMDPIAAIFGVRYGRRTWRSVFATVFRRSRSVSYILGAKTVEGSAAGFLAAFLAGIIAWTGPWAAYAIDGKLWWPEPSTVLTLSLVGALVATVSEAWPSQWDDNINIPFWTGLILWGTTVLLNIPMHFV